MGEAHEELRSLGAEVVAVFQYRAEPTANFCRRRGVDLDCLGDPERVAYRAVGLERASTRELLGPQLAKGLLRAARKGAFVGNPQGGDVAQRPGTFVVAADWTVAFAHYNKDSADNPPMERVLEVVRGIAQAGP